MRDDFRQAYRSFVHPLGRGSNRSVASDDMGWNARARIWNRHIVYLSADLNPLYLEGFKMTKTEDQIIAEAVRLAVAEGHRTLKEQRESVARHAIRLATQPEQDPALVKAMGVFSEARIAWHCTTTVDCQDKQAAAREIMEHYPAPPPEALGWARMSLKNQYSWARAAAAYILAMAGEKQ